MTDSDKYEDELWQDGFEVGYENGIQHASEEEDGGYIWESGDYSGTSEIAARQEYNRLNNEDANEDEDEEEEGIESGSFRCDRDDEEDYEEDDYDEEENKWRRFARRTRRYIADTIGEAMEDKEY